MRALGKVFIFTKITETIKIKILLFEHFYMPLLHLKEKNSSQIENCKLKFVSSKKFDPKMSKIEFLFIFTFDTN